MLFKSLNISHNARLRCYEIFLNEDTVLFQGDYKYIHAFEKGFMKALEMGVTLKKEGEG